MCVLSSFSGEASGADGRGVWSGRSSGGSIRSENDLRLEALEWSHCGTCARKLQGRKDHHLDSKGQR